MKRKVLLLILIFTFGLLTASIFFVKSTISQFKRLTENVSFQEVPETLAQATIVAYDKKYYAHDRFGADPVTMTRSGLRILVSNPNKFGLAYLTSKKLLNIKGFRDLAPTNILRSFIGFLYLEEKFSRDQVLYLFLQESTYVYDTKGINQTVKKYLGKEIKDLTLAESVVVVATIDNSPDHEAIAARASWILILLKEEKYITETEYENSKYDVSTIAYSFDKEYLQDIEKFKEKERLIKEELEKELGYLSIGIDDPDNINYGDTCHLAGSTAAMTMCNDAKIKYLNDELDNVQEKLNQEAAKPNPEIFDGRTNETFQDFAIYKAKNFRTANKSLHDYARYYCSSISDAYGSGTHAPVAFGSCVIDILSEQVIRYRLAARLEMPLY